MRKRTKQLSQLFWAIVIFLGLIVVIPETTYFQNATNTFLVNVYQFFDWLKTYVNTNVSLIALVAGIIAVAYFFMIHRPKRITR
jgi:uncharacterized BrkB/YihY/UPF0761 family membrane protein